MKRFTTSELREMEVINLCDGARLGYACDFEFDKCDGKILALIIPGDRGLFFGNKGNDIVIPWCKIECFGEDTVLVKIAPEECVFKCEKRKRRLF